MYATQIDARGVRVKRRGPATLFRTRAGRRRVVPHMEALEARTLLNSYVVTSPLDSGPGTLRQAILESDAAGGHNTIVFDLPPADPTIQPLTPLPAVTTPTCIDATTQPGYCGSPIVWIQATPGSAISNGLTLNAANSAVQGLAITGFAAGAGVELAGTSDQVFQDYLGIDPTGGGSPAESNLNGVNSDSTGNCVANSVLSNNLNAGANINADGTVVTGNLVGTDPSGKSSRPNNRGGVLVNSAGNVTIGGTSACDRNVISGNNLDGITVTDPRPGVVIQGNYVGVDVTGQAGVIVLPGPITFTGNQGNGISILALANPGSNTDVTIGGTACGAGNVIAANQGDGIFIQDASGNSVLGNIIGTDRTGTLASDVNGNPLANAGNGVELTGLSSNNAIGSTCNGGNLISGNFGDGVRFETPQNTSGNSVVANLIGTDITGSRPLGNSGNGVTASYNITIGTCNGGNIISANLGNGVAITGNCNLVVFNSIGVGTCGSGPGLGNTFDGVLISGGQNNTIGTPDAPNTIAFNGADGVQVGSTTADVTAIDNSVRGNSIFSNVRLGIELGDTGPNPNAPQPLVQPPGPNHLQNHPILTSAVRCGTQVTLKGTLNSKALTTFTIDLYANQQPDPSGFGQGQRYLGTITVTTDALGNATFCVTLCNVPCGWNNITATATDPSNNTSDFSNDQAVSG